MLTKLRILTIFLGLTLTIALFQLTQATSAQSARDFIAPGGNSAQAGGTPSPNSNCKKIRGNGLLVFDPLTGIVSGPITNSGLLDGTFAAAINFGAGFVFTPDPTVVAYTTETTITTIHGQLKWNSVTSQSLVTGAGTDWGHINSAASTDRFAGATGMIAVVFKPVGDPSVGPYEAEIIADICFAP